MSRRSVAVMLCFAMFVSTNVVSGVAAKSVDLASAQLAAPLGTDAVARVGLDSVAAFDPAGGWAAVDPATTTGELLYYRGLDALSNELSGVTRFAPGAHDAGAAVVPIEASDLVAAAGAPMQASATVWEAGALEAIVVEGVEGFTAPGLALATTTSGIELFYFAGINTASSALSDLGGADPSALSTTTSVSALDPTTPFPLVVDPPPVTVTVVDPSPVTVDPSPVGPYTIEPLDPSPIAVVGPDPDPVIADPSPIVQPGLDPDPVIADPPPIYVDGPDPAPVIADPSPIVQPGIDPDPVIADPAPIYIDGPDLGPVIADPPPVHKPGIDLAPIVADPPPVSLDGIDLAPIPVDPPPYAIGIDDPDPIYLDPPGYIVPGIDPPPIAHDVAPVAVMLPDPPPAGGTYVNPPTPGTISYDPPGAGGTYVNPAVPGPVTYDPPPLGGGYLTWPDTDPLCVDPSRVRDLIEGLIAGIDTPTLPPIALPPLPDITMSSSAICVDPADGQIIPIPPVDAPPVTVTVPDPCPGSGCYVPRVDPTPVSVTAPDPCPGSGCYVPKVDLAAPPPVYLDPAPVSLDLAPIPGATVNPAPISYDPAPLPGASGDPAAVWVDPPAVPDVHEDLDPVAVDLQPLPGVSQDPAAIVVDPDPVPDVNKDLDPVGVDLQPLPGVSHDPAAIIVDPDPVPDVNKDLDPAGVDVQPLPGVSHDPGAVIVDPTPVDVMFDPPALCNGGPDPINPSCTIPAVDAPPVTVDVPGVCTLGTGLCGTHDPAPVATIDPSSPPPLPGGVPVPIPGGLEAHYSVTPQGQVLVLTSNADQLYVGNKAARRRALARRIHVLSQKVVEDGMGMVPDIVLLNEVYEEQAQAIADELDTATGFDFTVMISFKSAESTVDDAAKRYTQKATAILYNSDTMRARQSQTMLSTYSLDDRCDDTPELQDADGDGIDDCLYATDETHATGLLQELELPVPNTAELSEPGSPPDPPIEVAVASVHFIQSSKVKRPDALKAKWATEIADEMEGSYGAEADAFVIGGDFNRHRCPDTAPAVFPQERVSCNARPFWTALHERSGNPFVDSVYAANSTNDATLSKQYKNGTTSTGAPIWAKRIDFIFARSDALLHGGSFDLTCGEPNGSCNDETHPDHYSDHRLLWALVGPASRPSTVLPPTDTVIGL